MFHFVLFSVLIATCPDPGMMEPLESLEGLIIHSAKLFSIRHRQFMDIVSLNVGQVLEQLVSFLDNLKVTDGLPAPLANNLAPLEKLKNLIARQLKEISLNPKIYLEPIFEYMNVIATTLASTLEEQEGRPCHEQVFRRNPVYMSSTLSTHHASYATDNDLNTLAITRKEVNPWWYMDLQYTLKILGVTITDSKNCGRKCRKKEKRLHRVTVYVGKTLNNMIQCAYFAGPATIGQRINLACPTGVKGRYVKIVHSGKGFLQLAEVRIMAKGC